jgi:predicted glycoside hydrolase/deacetylase ChbG (UPF0249 family)
MTRLLIVNADDFGLSPGINRGIIDAHERGVVTSASLMVRWPAADAAATYARTHPSLSVGLHVDLGEWAFLHGEWAALYCVPGDPEKVLLKQLQRFRELVGRDPTHLDSHQHVHRVEPLRSAMLALADHLEVAARELRGSIRYCGDFYGQDAAGEPLQAGISVNGLLGLLSSLQPGTTELGCHPGLDDDVDSMYGRERRREVETLCDPRIRRHLSLTGIRLVSFAHGSSRTRDPSLQPNEP